MPPGTHKMDSAWRRMLSLISENCLATRTEVGTEDHIRKSFNFERYSFTY